MELGRRERQIMEAVYQLGRATVAEVRAQLAGDAASDLDGGAGGCTALAVGFGGSSCGADRGAAGPAGGGEQRSPAGPGARSGGCAVTGSRGAAEDPAGEQRSLRGRAGE